MRDLEPRRLAEVRSLATHLEMEPGLFLPGIDASHRVTDLALLVIHGDQVLDDGARFPERCQLLVVGVDEGGQAAVGIQSDELGGFCGGHGEGMDGIGKEELFENNGNFPRIRGRVAIEDQGLENGRRHCSRMKLMKSGCGNDGKIFRTKNR